MPLPSSGAISLNDVNIELGRASGATISMNESAVRTLFGAGASGTAMSMSQGYGKSNRVTVTLNITSNTTNYNIFNNRGGSYVAGTTDVIVNVASGVVVSATATNVFAMETGTGWTTGDTIRINNSGTIVGRGGTGGPVWGSFTSTSPGTPGGAAMRFQFATSVNNTGIIGGGGGGGGHGAGNSGLGYPGAPGGGGGGFGARGGTWNNNFAADGTATAGGRGNNGWDSAGGAGGAAGVNGGVGGQGSGAVNGAGGGGGGVGASGGAGGRGNGGGWTNFGAGGGAGAATNGAPTFVSWVATGTRYGSIN